MKSKRQEEIIRIIENKAVGTQENLKRELENSGFNVTQATLSRDIKELNLVKTVDGNGMYKYCQSERGSIDSPGKFMNMESIVSADYALNTVVVKCHAGMAQGVCTMLDKSGIENSLGTIAGDDTIFILMRTENDAENLVKQLRINFHL